MATNAQKGNLLHAMIELFEAHASQYARYPFNATVEADKVKRLEALQAAKENLENACKAFENSWELRAFKVQVLVWFTDCRALDEATEIIDRYAHTAAPKNAR